MMKRKKLSLLYLITKNPKYLYKHTIDNNGLSLNQVVDKWNIKVKAKED